jgi:hypothetical protein
VFDFLLSPFEMIMDWIGYFLLFGAGIITILTLGAVIAIPIGLKLLGTAFAKTIVVETSKVIKDLNLDKITNKNTEQIKQELAKLSLVK